MKFTKSNLVVKEELDHDFEEEPVIENYEMEGKFDEHNDAEEEEENAEMDGDEFQFEAHMEEGEKFDAEEESSRSSLEEFGDVEGEDGWKTPGWRRFPEKNSKEAKIFEG